MAARPHMFRREVARSIRGSLGRFLAIMGIVALGCGFFAGLQMTGPDMREAADLWYDGTDLWDLRVISTLGFSDDDVARVRAVEGVEAAMPARSCDVMASAGDEQEAVRITSIDTAVAAASQVTGLYAVTSDDHDYLNRPMLREGRWPEAADECVVSADAVDGFAVGDTVEVLYGAEDLDGMLEVANFGSTTLGSGQIDDYLYVQDDAFVEDFPYTEIFVTVEGAIDEASESDAYQAVVNRVKSRLEDREGALASARRDDLEDEAQAELDQRRADYEVEKADAEAQLADAAAQLEGLRAALGAGGQEYQKGLAAYEQQRQEADEQFADAERELAEAQAEIDAIELPDLYLLDRTQSEGAATYHADADRIDRIADVFPALFFLVAALVALTTMTRMVEDDRIQIGTYKALGYGTATIASKYLAYAAIAGTVGAAAGTLVLTQVLPYIITNSYAIIYATPILPFPMPIDPATALASGGLGVGVTLLATWGAVVTSLRATPAELMLPRAPKAGKRILLERAGALWSRVSFSRKVTLRNLFRYKRRFAMTVIGIAGCTALLLVGFGLHDAIWDIIDRQFGPVIHYDTTVGLDESSTTEDVDEVVAYLEDAGATNIVRARQENMQAGSDNYSGSLRVAVLIPQDAAGFGDAVTFKDRVTQEHLHFGTDDVYLPEKTASLLGVGVGDSIRLYDQDAIGNAVGEGCALTVTGVVENYVGNLVYVGRDAWADVNEGDAVDASTTTTDASASDAIDASAAEPVFSTLFFARGDQVSKQALSRGLHDLRGVSTVTFTDETIDTYRTMLGVVNLIVVVLIVSAAALAFIVLYNLTNINIDERIREIASLRVLGFTRREVHTYVFREIALLAVIGDALGMVAGTYLARFVVVTAEVDYVMFGRVIHLTSYLYSFGLTLVFAALVLVMMRRKLDRVSMVESLKSVD